MAFLHLFCTWRPSCRMIGNGMSAFQSVFKNRLIPPKEIVQQLCVWPVLRWRVIYWTWYNPIISPTFLSVSLSLVYTHTHTQTHRPWLFSCNDTPALHGWMEWKMGRVSGETGEGNERKGWRKWIREETEKRSRPKASNFSVWRDVSVHSCPKRWRRWLTAMLLTTPRQNQAFIPHIFLFCICILQS